MKKLQVTLLFLFITSLCLAQDLKSEFDLASSNKDTAKQLLILQKWKKAEPLNPELFTSYFNYYFNKSKQEILTISQNIEQDNKLFLTDSTGELAGSAIQSFIMKKS